MGQGAFNVASDLRQLQKSEGDAAVFYPTLLYNMCTENEEETVLRDALKRQLDSAFGPLNREVIRGLCFLNEKSLSTIRDPAL